MLTYQGNDLSRRWIGGPAIPRARPARGRCCARGRNAAGQTQEAFGRGADVSASHVSTVEDGARTPTMDFIRGTDRVLGLIPGAP
jgi:hypothetical protein